MKKVPALAAFAEDAEGGWGEIARSPALHDNNLADLDAKYADVIDLGEAVERLGR